MDYKIKETFESTAELENQEWLNAPTYYKRLKEKHPEYLLLFRVGDFYETYCDDAQMVSDILGVLMTQFRPYRLVGFPAQWLQAPYDYLRELIEAGKKVALCDNKI